MAKYMLTIQYAEQKVAYFEFTADNDKQAERGAITLFRSEKDKNVFIPKFPFSSGNFSGIKPEIISHHLSKWVQSANSTNANGRYCGGYWSTI